MCAKYYENSTMLSRVTAKNVGDVFLRHTVDQNSNRSDQDSNNERNIVLVINTNLHPISYRFEVIADSCSNFGRKTVTLLF